MQLDEGHVIAGRSPSGHALGAGHREAPEPRWPRAIERSDPAADQPPGDHDRRILTARLARTEHQPTPHARLPENLRKRRQFWLDLDSLRHLFNRLPPCERHV